MRLCEIRGFVGRFVSRLGNALIDCCSLLYSNVASSLPNGLLNEKPLGNGGRSPKRDNSEHSYHCGLAFRSQESQNIICNSSTMDEPCFSSVLQHPLGPARLCDAALTARLDRGTERGRRLHNGRGFKDCSRALVHLRTHYGYPGRFDSLGGLEKLEIFTNAVCEVNALLSKTLSSRLNLGLKAFVRSCHSEMPVLRKAEL